MDNEDLIAVFVAHVWDYGNYVRRDLHGTPPKIERMLGKTLDEVRALRDIGRTIIYKTQDTHEDS
jgi:hypothetical protein